MYNRGFRRDDNSFRSNLNMSRGNNAPSLMSVSPWEGGVVPGSGSSSILGSPNMQNMNNSNLISPQAAALAQNLNILSNLGLLQSQLQSRQPQGLPSLVNMTSNLNRSLGQQSNYRQVNQMINRGMPNRFQDQRPNKYGRQDGRRPEPFNKNRPRTSQSQTSQQKLQSYRPLNSKVSPLQAARKPASQGAGSLVKARPDPKAKRANFKKDVKKQEPEAETESNSKKDGEETTTKRDWKTEKKSDTVEDEDDSDAVKEELTEEEAEGKRANGDDTIELMEVETLDEAEVKDPSDAEGKEKKDKDGNKRLTFFNCHVCTKNMWDERSLSNHLRSAAHKRMMSDLEQTYALKVKRLRMQMKAIEDQKDVDKSRNRGRRLDLISRGHCKMCDLTFHGNIATHRKTQLHLKLKNFLHPNCVPCGMEFPARMEWDLHKLTTLHCRNMASLDRRRKGVEEGKHEPNFARTIPKFPEGLDSDIADMALEEADKAAASDTEEIGEDGEVKKKILSYDPNVPAGLNMLVHGQHCGVCSKFFSKRGDAVEHCKTRSHFDSYLVLKAKLQEAAAEAARVAAEEKAAKVAAAKEKAADKEITADEEKAAHTEEKTVAEALTEDPVIEAADETECDKSSGISADTKLTADMMPVVCLNRSSAGKEEGNWKRQRPNKKDEDDDDEEDELNSSAITNDLKKEELEKHLDSDGEKYDPVEPTPLSPSSSTNVLETSFDILQAVEDCIDSVESEIEPQSDTSKENLAAKPANRARRGRKRK